MDEQVEFPNRVTDKIFKNREELNLSIYRINKMLFYIDTKARIENNHGIDPNYNSIQKTLESCQSLLVEAQRKLQSEISR